MSGTVFIEIYMLKHNPKHEQMSLGELFAMIPPLNKINMKRIYHSTSIYDCGNVEMKQFDVAITEGDIDIILLCLFVTPGALEDNLVYFVGDVVAATEQKIMDRKVIKTGMIPLPGIGFYFLYENVDNGRYLRSFIDPKEIGMVYH